MVALELKIRFVILLPINLASEVNVTWLKCDKSNSPTISLLERSELISIEEFSCSILINVSPK